MQDKCHGIGEIVEKSCIWECSSGGGGRGGSGTQKLHYAAETHNSSSSSSAECCPLLLLLRSGSSIGPRGHAAVCAEVLKILYFDTTVQCIPYI